MQRESGIHIRDFPYASDGVIGTHSDGTISAVPTGRESNYDIAVPSQIEGDVVGKRNAIIPGGIGNTDYVIALQVSHGVLAGDS